MQQPRPSTAKKKKQFINGSIAHYITYFLLNIDDIYTLQFAYNAGLTALGIQ